MTLRGRISGADWGEARAAICDRATESSVLQHLWEMLQDIEDPNEARAAIVAAGETTTSMLVMLDNWLGSAEDDGVTFDEPEAEPPPTIVGCSSKHSTGDRCSLTDGHDGDHHSETTGESWS